MYNRKQILEIYNKISDDKLDNSELLTILPKLYLIINKVNVDEVELIRTIDAYVICFFKYSGLNFNNLL